MEYRARLLVRLETITRDIRNAIAEIPKEKWHSGTPSPHQVLARLRNMEKIVYSVRLQRVLDEDSPTMEMFNINQWEAVYYDPNESVEKMLNEYDEIRRHEIKILRALTPPQWTRLGRHSIFGIRTVQWWAERMLEHAALQLRELRAS